MRPWSALPRPFLAALAGVFASVAVLYGSLWMYGVRYPGPDVELGFNQVHNPHYDARTHSLSVDDVVAGSPAAQAGLRAGDRITAVNGRTLGTEIGSDESYVRGHPGDAVALTIERPGESKPLVLHAVFRTKRSLNRAGESLARSSALQVIGLFPIPFLVVGRANGVALGIAVLRVHRRSRSYHSLGSFSCAGRIRAGVPGDLLWDARSALLSLFCPVPGPVCAGSAIPMVEVAGPGLWDMYCLSRAAGRASKLPASGG